MKLFVLLILTVFATEKNDNDCEIDPKYGENPIIVKIEEDEYAKKKSKFIGVSFNKSESKWKAERWSKIKNTSVFNGYYNDEETAAHASDTLARKLMENDTQNLKLNFPEDHTEVYPEKSSKFIGVSYHQNTSKWRAQRWKKSANKLVTNGYYNDEETAAHASDALARKLMENGEQNHRLNFPEDHAEVYPEKSSKFIGVSYHQNTSKWRAQRWNKSANKLVTNGYYDDEETAAHASDTLARKLMENSEQKHKINFPEDHTEVYPEKNSKFIGLSYNKNESKWKAQRWSKSEKKMIYNGLYANEETAAHASDALARKLMENGEQILKLNFPQDYTEVYQKNQKKRKRPQRLGLEHTQIN